MAETLTSRAFTRVTGTDDAPSVWREGWLPDVDLFPELSHARAEYERLLAKWQSAGAERRATEEAIEQDKAGRADAMREAILAGGDAVPEQDDPALGQRLRVARERSQAALSALIEHINEGCIGLVVERQQEWRQALTDRQTGLDAQIRELEAQLAPLRAQRGDTRRVEYWLYRTGVEAASMPALHYPYAEIVVPAATEAEEQQRMDEAMERSFAGGWGPDRRATVEQGQAMERRMLDGPSGEPEEHIDFGSLEEDDLVDWLMGTGAFDGKPKPGADTVLALSEGEPDIARRLSAAERRANSEAPRQELLAELDRIGGTA